jgi:ABC-type nickel/cobalt efflux system permease component RcnA
MNSERASYVIWVLLVIVGLVYAIVGAPRPLSIAIGLAFTVLGIAGTIWTWRRSKGSQKT